MKKTKKQMKKIKTQKQVVAIYANKYEVVFTDANPEKVAEYVKANRRRLKKAGALKVLINTGFYEV